MAAINVGEDIDRALSPGAIASTNVADVCLPGFADRHGSISQQRANEVFDRYGIQYNSRLRYRVTFVIGPGIGGSNDIRNLWPVDVHTMERKDAVDTDLQEAVCSGRIPLAEAQRRVRTDWHTAVTW